MIATLADDIPAIIDTESGKTDNLATVTPTRPFRALNQWLAFGYINNHPRRPQDRQRRGLAGNPRNQPRSVERDDRLRLLGRQPGFRMDTVSIASDAPAASATPTVSGDFASKVQQAPSSLRTA